MPRSAPLYGHEWTLEGTPAWLERHLGWRCAAHDMPELRFVGHHPAHATIAFHAPDFEHAAVLVVDAWTARPDDVRLAATARELAGTAGRSAGRAV